MNQCRCHEGFIEAKTSGSLKVTDTVTVYQSHNDDNCWYEISYQCTVCGGSWIIDAHSEHGKDIEDVKEFRVSGNNKKSADADKEIILRCIGNWTDHNGVLLKIYIESDSVKADYIRSPAGHNESIEPVAFRNLDAGIVGSVIFVELGVKGLGPTLDLSLQIIDNRDILIPSLGLGLYDDYLDDLGAALVLPLKPFERISSADEQCK